MSIIWQTPYTSVEMIMGMGWILIHPSHSHWEFHGNGNDDTIGNENGNKFPSADSVFSLCNSNVPFII